VRLMDTLVSKDSLTRRHVALDEKGALLRSGIEEAIATLPNRKAWGRRYNDRKCVELTLDLIQRLYAGEDPREDTSPAVNHILRVAHRIAVEWGVKDANVIMAALLHDAVEDHPEILARRGDRKKRGKDDHADAIEFVQKMYGGKLARIVDRVSKRKNKAELPPQKKLAAYVSYVQGLARDPAALVIKISDVCDNIANPRPTSNGGFYSMRKYWSVLEVLETGLSRNEGYIRNHCGETAFLEMQKSLGTAKTQASGFLLGMPATEG
jgi:hypothetical protein